MIKMMTDRIMLHFGLLTVVSLGFSWNVPCRATETALDASVEDAINFYPSDTVYLDKPLEQRLKRILSDYGYGSRLQAGENVADSMAKQLLFGPSGPGKRSFDATNGNEKDKRINTDYGYGSRMRAGENVAMDWGHNGLFGMYGPGKRSGDSGVKQLDTKKRMAADFGYGSRARAAENAANSASYGDIFGVYGPGKRNIIHEIPGVYSKDGLFKRFSSDYGYGSRLQAAENIAKLASKENLFGIYGPGKRSDV